MYGSSLQRLHLFVKLIAAHGWALSFLETTSYNLEHICNTHFIESFT